MSTPPDTRPELEELLSAALTARAELVRPEDLAPLGPLATVAPLRPRWQSPWVLLATAAVLLLVLGVVFQGIGGRQRSDDTIAPEPDETQVELQLPADIGRDWQADDISSPARLDLDGDGTKEKVEFLDEPTKKYDGRTRLQTTLSATGEEAWGIAQLSTTIGIDVLDPIDADDDGDQELVLYYDDLEAVGGGGYPLVFDLRDGLLVQAAVEDPDLLVRGQVPVPGEETEFYDMVRIHDYGIEDGTLVSSRSVNAFATGNMTLMRPERMRVDTWVWTLGEDGALRATSSGCRVQGIDSSDVSACSADESDTPPVVTPVADETIGAGEQARLGEGYTFEVRIATGDPGVVVVEGGDGREVRGELDVADPRINTQQPTAVFYDGASLLVTSGSDPSVVEVLVQDGDRLRALEPVGDVRPGNADDVRTWLTQGGSLVTVVAEEDDTWQAWKWVMVSRTEMAAFPTGTVCFDDVDDPDTARAC